MTRPQSATVDPPIDLSWQPDPAARPGDVVGSLAAVLIDLVGKVDGGRLADGEGEDR